jgi:isoleucyl-tRNA synthetase
VLTHGFIVAEDGRKMSKSLGNSIEPQDIIKQSGADILRLWVAMSDCTQEVRLSREILARAAEAYRKIRNTMRYLYMNLYDFNPAADRVAADRLAEVDRYILARYAEQAQRVLHAYRDYDYPTIFQILNGFMTVDLSAFYADVCKDRLYTFAPRSRERRSAQSAMYLMADGLTRLLAPILAFTTDELWQFLPGEREESVHIGLFSDGADLASLTDHSLLARWARLIGVRDQVLAAIEPLRKDKTVGSSLEAKVALSASKDDLVLLEAYRDDLPMLLIVSQVTLEQGNGSLTVTVTAADGVKCGRCWRIVPSVSSDPERGGICDRRVDALAEPVSS